MCSVWICEYAHALICMYPAMCLCGCENVCILEVYRSWWGVNVYLCVLENCGAKCMYTCLCVYWEDANLYVCLGTRLGKFLPWAWVGRGLCACWNNYLAKSNNFMVAAQHWRYQSPALKSYPKSVGALPQGKGSQSQGSTKLKSTKFTFEVLTFPFCDISCALTV